MKAVLLGIGSPFGADRIGWLIANVLRYSMCLQPLLKSQQLTIRNLDRPGVRLLSYWKDYSMVFIVDAVMSDAGVGALYQLSARQVKQNNLLQSTHGVGLAETIALAESLNEMPEHFSFYGINIKQYQVAGSSFVNSIRQLKEQVKIDLLKKVSFDE